MSIYKVYNNEFKNEELLYSALNIDLNKKQIISFVGGGGKTSSIYKLAEEIAKNNKKVIVTTTTHMEIPKSNYELSNNLDIIKTKIKENNILTVGLKFNNIKISSLEYKDIDKLANICDILLIEADGSRKLPIKIPAEHEPVIFEKTDLVIALCGIDGLNKKVEEVCHRKELSKVVLGKNEEDKITIEDIVKLLSSKNGQMKNLHDIDNNLKYKYRVIINKVDNDELKEKAFDIINKLKDNNIEAIATSYNI